jgi:nuclear transport factor 2 (NTF2) superfamily protein
VPNSVRFGNLKITSGFAFFRRAACDGMPKYLLKREIIFRHQCNSMKASLPESRPPFPPFTHETAVQKVRGGENAWNGCKPDAVSLAYTSDCTWRNRSEFLAGRAEIVAFLTRKWARELDYRLIKELWAFTDARIAVRFAYEYHDGSGAWFRAYGNENWEFNEDGLMSRRIASINDLAIAESGRKFHWDRSAPRPADHPGLSDLGL